MTNVRSNLGYIIGSAIAGVGVFISWFFESGFVGTIVAVVIGAVISSLVQTRTQRAAWKREYAIKTVEQIYSPLFGVLKTYISILEGKDYYNTSFGFWDSAQKDHRYFMVDEKFRKQLDAFLVRTSTHSHTIHRLDSILIPNLIKKSAKETFKEEPESGNIVLSVLFFQKKKEPYSFGIGDLVRKLKPQSSFEDLIDYATENSNIEKKDITRIGVEIKYRKVLAPLDKYRQQKEKEGDYSFSNFTSRRKDRIEAFWKLCLQRLANIPEYQLVVKENDSLLEEAKQIMRELIKRIEEPWSI